MQEYHRNIRTAPEYHLIARTSPEYHQNARTAPKYQNNTRMPPECHQNRSLYPRIPISGTPHIKPPVHPTRPAKGTISIQNGPNTIGRQVARIPFSKGTKRAHNMQKKKRGSRQLDKKINPGFRAYGFCHPGSDQIIHVFKGISLSVPKKNPGFRAPGV